MKKNIKSSVIWSVKLMLSSYDIIARLRCIYTVEETILGTTRFNKTSPLDISTPLMTEQVISNQYIF